MCIICDGLVMEAVVKMECCSCNDERRKKKKGRDELPRAPFIVKFLTDRSRYGDGAMATG